ncbi:MAG: single-stranded DNA-binding protein [Campylobacter sp.]|nr:single-stranded DNA-binding protein [Campylobacter sp.]
MNNLQVLGRIATEVKLEISQSGVKYMRLNIVYNKNIKVGDEWQQKSHFFPCSAFGYVAEKIANHFKKGDRILINGALEQNTYTDKDGNVQSKLAIMIAEADIIEPKLKSENQANQAKESGVSANERPANKYTDSFDEVPF